MNEIAASLIGLALITATGTAAHATASGSDTGVAVQQGSGGMTARMGWGVPPGMGGTVTESRSYKSNAGIEQSTVGGMGSGTGGMPGRSESVPRGFTGGTPVGVVEDFAPGATPRLPMPPPQ